VNTGSTGIDDGRYAGVGAIADVIEVQHALDGIGLIAVDEGFRVPIK
jgi:Lon protease-like protein